MGNYQTRVHWIDVVKGVAIFLVILQHCIGMLPKGNTSIICKTILSFHMPLFFCISGFLHKSKKDDLFFKRKIISLFFVNTVFKILSIIIRIVFYYANLYKYADFLCFAGFWFVDSLFYIVICFYLFDQIIAKKSNIIFIIASITSLLIGCLYSKMIVGTENIMATSLIGMFFFIVGYISKQYFDRLEIRRGLLFLLFAALFGLTVIISRYNAPVYMYRSDYGNVFVFVITALLGILCIFMLGKLIENNRCIEFFGRNSIIVLFTHFPLFKISMAVMLKCGINSTLCVLIAFCMICFIEYFVIKFVAKNMPFLTGKMDV